METTTTPSGLTLTKFVKRPGLGKVGRQIRVRANFFEVTSFPRANVHHYDVTITPDVPPKLNRRIYRKFEEDNANTLNNIRPVFDGRKNMYSAKKLPFGDSATFDVILPEDDGVTTSKRPPRAFKFKVQKVAEINMEELSRYLQRKTELSNNILTAINSLDVLIRHGPSMDPNFVSIGRSLYTSENSQALFGGAEVWQGYYQSVRPTGGKMMINVDLSATAFYQGGPLINMVTKLLGRRNPGEIGMINVGQRSRLEKDLKNLKICVNHRGNDARRRRYKILKLTEKNANQTEFEADGQKMTVAQYFTRKYNTRLNFPNFPLVAVRNDIFLPIEICDVIP
ncbi:3353_t:CDS:2, partial [Acaulospora colombiana]